MGMRLRLRDVVEHIIIDPRKLTDYALNPDSPLGRHKARVFRAALGFGRENYSDLMCQLEKRCPEARAILGREDRFGRRFTVDVEIKGANGQMAIVRTGWIVPPESHTARLVTLYVM
jgi:hypothetical protein